VLKLWDDKMAFRPIMSGHLPLAIFSSRFFSFNNNNSTLNMNRIKLLMLALVLVAVAGCRDEDLNPIPVYETSVHGWGRLDATSPKNFVYEDLTKDITIKFQWNSIDGLLNVNKIEFYAFFDESYKDTDGNDRIARHAGRFLNANGAGKLFKTLQGSEIPANRTDITLTFSQQSMYELFKDAEFDYGKGKVKVFANPDKPDRDVTKRPFIAGDQLEVSWVLYTNDGRKFDYWSESICSEEFPKSSCTVKWGVVCVSDLAGEFDYVQTDMVKGSGGGAGDPAPGEITGTIKWKQDSTGTPLKPILGQYSTPDFSFGHFAFVWADAPAYKASNPPKVTDACNILGTKGIDQYDDTYTYKVLKVEGTALTIRWNNTWGDAGTVKLTRKDGKNWPPLRN